MTFPPGLTGLFCARDWWRENIFAEIESALALQLKACFNSPQHAAIGVERGPDERKNARRPGASTRTDGAAAIGSASNRQ